MTAVVVPYMALAVLAVCLTPLDTALAEPHRLTGIIAGRCPSTAAAAAV